MFPFLFDPLYLMLICPAVLVMLFAQWQVRSAYSKWTRIANNRGLVGTKAAESLLTQNGLHGVQIRGIPGEMTDNYDPRSKTLNLSQGSATGNSVASLAIVAHEIGHAEQDKAGSFLMQLRSGIVPAVQIGSSLGPWLFFFGIILRFQPLLWIGIVLFSSAFAFALVTLPVELDASNRAMRMLTSSGFLVGQQEQNGARQVLNAAALTYVAGLLMALMQLLYYVMLAAGGRRRS